MKELFEAWKRVDRNLVAAGMSVVPGLGHLYKHHYAAGFSILIGNIVVGFVATLMALGTLGLSLMLVPVGWLAGVACSAYLASDEHGHHSWLHVWEYHWRDWLHGKWGISRAEQSHLSSGL